MPSSRLVILPYKMGSVSAKKLALGLSNKLGLRVRRVKQFGKYRPKANSVVVNYGSGQQPLWWRGGINEPLKCAISGNKLTAFRRLQEHNVRTVEWTSLQQVACNWIAAGKTVMCRTILNAHSGRGIHIARTATEVVPCQLYTLYKKKKKEFRVHVYKGQVIDVSEKRRRSGESPSFDGLVRNLSNGWVFCRDSIVKPSDLDNLAIAATTALGLDFGAVDIIWNEKENLSYVLEINTAPGLEGTTLQRYVDAIAKEVQ